MRKQEEAMRIMEALSGVDETLLARCEAEDMAEAEDISDGVTGLRREPGRRTDRKRRQGGRAWRYLSRLAAAFALAAVGAASWGGLQLSRNMMSNESVSGGSPGTVAMDYGYNQDLGEEVTEGEGSGDGFSGNVAVDGRVLEDMVTESQITEKDMQDGVLPMPAAENPEINGAGGTGSADGSSASGGSNASVRTDGLSALDGSNASGGTDGTSVQDGSNASVSTEGTDCDDIFDMVKAECVVGGMRPAVRELTVDEARQIDPLGDYVPTALPAGYDFGFARYYEEIGSLTIWLRKDDVFEILLGFKQVDSGAVGTVDIQKPETYDERLYEIPFADTVPEEYRETFSDPVFAQDDFSLEIVCSRVLSYSGDSGDTATPWGQFSVLYDGVQVWFNGRGTPEEIWEMFSSISKQ